MIEPAEEGKILWFFVCSGKKKLCPAWFFQEAGEQDGGSGKGRGHEEAGGEAAGAFSQDPGDCRAGDLAEPEDEGDEPEGRERLVDSNILAHRCDHDRRDGPGNDAVKADRQIEEQRREVCSDHEVCKRLEREHDHEPGLPAEAIG